MNDRNLRNYLLGYFLVYFSESLIFVGVSWLLFEATSEIVSIGRYFILISLIGIFLSPVMGKIVAKRNKQRSIIVSMIVKVICGFAIFLYLKFFEFYEPILLILVGIVAICDRAIWPATSVLLKELFKDKLVRVNSLGSICSQAGYIFGASASGLIIAAFGNSSVFLSFAIVQVLATLFFVFISYSDSEVESEASKTETEEKPFFPSNTLVISAMLQSILYSMLHVLNVLLTPFCSEVIKVGAKGLGYIDSAWAIGAVIGGSLATLFLKGMMPIRRMAIQLLCLSGLVALFGQSNGLTEAMFIYIALGVFFVMSRVGMESNIQLLTPSKNLAVFKGYLSSINSVLSLSVYLSVSIFATIENLRDFYLYFSYLILFGLAIAVCTRLIAKMYAVRRSGSL